MYPECSVSAMLYDKYLRKLMQSLKAIFPVITIDYKTPLFCMLLFFIFDYSQKQGQFSVQIV